ncbi:DMT family protein [Prevotella sp. HUN102]|uniref:DMT family protein n=1 Tax=Prevotella sp. HUN102 TaxID=1392486 RepID=UPI00048C6939|nr:DMT family protein [Prevotella sp. HUN102]
MNGLYTIVLLVVSNVFMTFAWYGHIKLQQAKVLTDATPLYVVILLSWLLALAEYSFQIPANRMGYVGNGGLFSLMQLKIIQEVISLVVFTVFTVVFFNGESLHWNHLVAFCCLILAVFFAFLK